MKIVSVTSLYRPHVGGVETMVEEMSTELLSMDHEVEVISKLWPVDLPKQETIDGVRIVRTRSGIDNHAVLTAAQEFTNLAPNFQSADIVHVVGMRRPFPMFAAILGQTLGKPVVATVVGSEIPNPNSPSSENVWAQGSHYMPDAYRNMRMVSAVSESTAMLTQKVVPEIAQIQNLPVGIDVEGYDRVQPYQPRQSHGRFILALRRLEHDKGIDILIDAYKYLRSVHSIPADIDLVIAGDGSERQHLEDQASRHGLGESVKFIGTVAMNEAIGMLKKAELTVVPSRAEGGGLVNTEANAVMCPLVAADVGGIREYTTSEASVLVRPDDVLALADGISSIVNNETLRESVRIAGRAFAEQRDWSVVMDRYLNFYTEAASQKQQQLSLNHKFSIEIAEAMNV